MKHSLDGRIALVIGADSPNGAAIAVELAMRGATVGAQYLHSLAEAKRVVRAIEGLGGMAVAFKADPDDPVQAELLYVRVRGALGRIDVVVAENGRALSTSVRHASDAVVVCLPNPAGPRALADAVVLLVGDGPAADEATAVGGGTQA